MPRLGFFPAPRLHGEFTIFRVMASRWTAFLLMLNPEMSALREGPVRLLILSLVVMIAGCSEDPRTGIIGSWEGISLKQDFRFYADGRAELLDRKHGAYRGRCSFLESGEMSCRFERFAYPVVRSVRVRGNKLILTNSNGQDEEYRRK